MNPLKEENDLNKQLQELMGRREVGLSGPGKTEKNLQLQEYCQPIVLQTRACHHLLKL